MDAVGWRYTYHTANETIELLQTRFGDKLISRNGLVNWPPRQWRIYGGVLGSGPPPLGSITIRNPCISLPTIYMSHFVIQKSEKMYMGIHDLSYLFMHDIIILFNSVRHMQK